MKFSQEQVDRLVSGKPVQLRKLAKEGEFDASRMVEIFKNFDHSIKSVWIKDKKIKWEVGRDYAVQLGKAGLWYCPKCKIKGPTDAIGICCSKCGMDETDMLMLRIKITGIRKEQNEWVLEVVKK